jgi:hypothetical protein
VTTSDKNGKCLNFIKPPEIKINNNTFNEEVRNNIVDYSDLTSAKFSKRGRRQLTRVDQSVFSETYSEATNLEK